MKQILIIGSVVVLLIVVGAGAFFVGDQFGPSAQARNAQAEFLRTRTFQAGQGGDTLLQGQGQRGQFAGRPVAAGTVKSIQGKTIQVTQQDGTTVAVELDDKTTIQKTITATLTDIQPGVRITVTEQTTGGGTVRRVQLVSPQ